MLSLLPFWEKKPSSHLRIAVVPMSDAQSLNTAPVLAVEALSPDFLALVVNDDVERVNSPGCVSQDPRNP